MSFGWYLARPRGSPIGPLRAEALIRRIRGGSLSPAELVWKEGMSAWKKIAHIAELMGQEVEPEEERAPDTTPETRREPERAFEEGAPETRPGKVPPAVLERARGGPALAATVVSPSAADSASFSRIFADGPGQPAPVIQALPETHDEAPPATLNFGSKGMIIVTAPTPPVSTLILSPEARRQAASAWAAEQRAAAQPHPAQDSPHTVRMPSAPPRPLYGDIPVTQDAYDQLVAEQEQIPPQSIPPPPYPSNFPPPIVPSQQIPFPLVSPHAPTALAPQGSGLPPQPASAPGRTLFPVTAGGRVLLVFIILGALALGFVAARYVVRTRRFPFVTPPAASSPPSALPVSSAAPTVSAEAPAPSASAAPASSAAAAPGASASEGVPATGSATAPATGAPSASAAPSAAPAASPPGHPTAPTPAPTSS